MNYVRNSKAVSNHHDNSTNQNGITHSVDFDFVLLSFLGDRSSASHFAAISSIFRWVDFVKEAPVSTSPHSSFSHSGVARAWSSSDVSFRVIQNKKQKKKKRAKQSCTAYIFYDTKGRQGRQGRQGRWDVENEPPPQLLALVAQGDAGGWRACSLSSSLFSSATDAFP